MGIRATLLLALLAPLAGAAKRPVWPEPRPLDAQRLSRAGVRVVETPRLTLVTDLPASPELDELPRVVAAALPLLAERFGVPADELRDWRLRAYLMGEREKFAALGLLPDDNARFPHGFALGHEAWLVEQPTPYYRRHLLLHEATHSFMMTELGGCGPGWHMEGVAELLGTHAWDARGARLRLGVMPPSREAAPYWGRIKRVRETSPPLAIAAVLKTDNRQALSNESYAWVWALAKFLDAHPRYRERFRALREHVLEDEFNAQFRAAYRQDARHLAAEWRVFASTLEYGHDLQREAIHFKSTKLLGPQPATVVVAADRGWQSTGLRVNQGDRLRFAPSGRFTIARDADGAAWPCESNGVTFRYHSGRPLGVLLAAVGLRGLTEPIVIGGGGTFTMPRDGELLFRVNDSPAELAENEGTLSVEVARE